jgi:hypothetical protein
VRFFTMTVRLSERRIPATLQPADLGEAIATDDARAVLVSYITSPLVVERDNVYVLFVVDETLAERTAQFEWTFALADAEPDRQETDVGEVSFRPKATGDLRVTARLVDDGGAEQASLTLSQEVVDPNGELESLIDAARNEPGPGVGNPEVARELINDHNPYYQAVTLRTPESGDSFREMIFGLVSDGAQRRAPSRRAEQLNRLATSLNSAGDDFATLSAEAAGVCGIRLGLLAMVVGRSASDPTPHLEWTELPDVPPRRAVADEQLCQRVAALEDSAKADLFNIVRFPKSNITHCARIVETLRDRYFTGASFDDVLNGLSGTRAHWIVRHFREGPLSRV